MHMCHRPLWRRRKERSKAFLESHPIIIVSSRSLSGGTFVAKAATYCSGSRRQQRELSTKCT